MNQYQFYKIFLFLAAIWIIFALLELLCIKGFIDLFNRGNQSYFSLTMVVIFLSLILNPFDFFYRSFRFEFIVSFWYNIISPFGLVRFRDFLLGDVLTSLVKPVIDVYFIACFFLSDAWKDPLLNE